MPALYLDAGDLNSGPQACANTEPVFFFNGSCLDVCFLRLVNDLVPAFSIPAREEWYLL